MYSLPRSCNPINSLHFLNSTNSDTWWILNTSWNHPARSRIIFWALSHNQKRLNLHNDLHPLRGLFPEQPLSLQFSALKSLSSAQHDEPSHSTDIICFPSLLAKFSSLTHIPYLYISCVLQTRWRQGEQSHHFKDFAHLFKFPPSKSQCHITIPVIVPLKFVSLNLRYIPSRT